MDKELIENIANALAVSEICPFAHEDCIDNCHKHFSNWLANHDEQIRAEERERILKMVNWKAEQDVVKRKIDIHIDFAEMLTIENVLAIITEQLRTLIPEGAENELG